MSNLRIIHLSDLHLFVNADGAARDVKERSKAIRSLARLAKLAGKSFAELAEGFNTHDQPALQAMQRTLQRILAASRSPTVVLQTGDVSAFGGTVHRDDVQFPDWEYWTGEFKQALPLHPPNTWVDLFGNHDVWPGTWPAAGMWQTRQVQRALQRRFVPNRHPYCIAHGGPRSIGIYVLNSVVSSGFWNTFAFGDLGTDQQHLGAYPCGSGDPLHELARLAHEYRDVERARLLVLHHPPHHFKAGQNPLTEGPLTRAGELGSWLEDLALDGLPFQVVMAGHRHILHPLEASDAPQFFPLPDGCLQLVCGSPTQLASAAAPKPNFSVYDLELRANELRLVRTVLDHDAFDDEFTQSETKQTWDLDLS